MEIIHALMHGNTLQEPAAEPAPSAYPAFNAATAREVIGKRPDNVVAEPHPEPVSRTAQPLPKRRPTPPPPPPRPASFSPPAEMEGGWSQAALTMPDGCCRWCPGTMCVWEHLQGAKHQRAKKVEAGLNALAGVTKHPRFLYAGAEGALNRPLIEDFWGPYFSNDATRFQNMAWSVLLARSRVSLRPSKSGTMYSCAVGHPGTGAEIVGVRTCVVSYHVHCRQYSGQQMVAWSSIGSCGGPQVPPPLSWWPTVQLVFEEGTWWEAQGIAAYVCIYQLLEDQVFAWCDLKTCG